MQDKTTIIRCLPSRHFDLHSSCSNCHSYKKVARCFSWCFILLHPSLHPLTSAELTGTPCSWSCWSLRFVQIPSSSQRWKWSCIQATWNHSLESWLFTGFVGGTYHILLHISGGYRIWHLKVIGLFHIKEAENFQDLVPETRYISINKSMNKI